MKMAVKTTTKGENKNEGDSLKKIILLEFTGELIKNSVKKNVQNTQRVIERMPEKIPQKPIRNFQKSPSRPPQKSPVMDEKEYQRTVLPPMKRPVIMPRKPIMREIHPRIPLPKKSNIPPRFQYLKPVPTNIEIDLGKLNPLLKDPLVQEVECMGEDTKIIVKGMMGRKKTNVVLSKEEIDEIIQKFSETTKIPVQEGFFKVAAGKLVLSAVVSGVVSSKFTIKKMVYNPGYR